MKLRNFSDLSPERIVWEDIIEHGDTWATESSIQEFLSDKADAHVEQVGYVIAEDDKWLLLASSFAESDETYSNVIKIPKVVIIDRIELEDMRWKRARENGMRILNQWLQDLGGNEPIVLPKQDYHFTKLKGAVEALFPANVYRGSKEWERLYRNYREQKG